MTMKLFKTLTAAIMTLAAGLSMSAAQAEGQTQTQTPDQDALIHQGAYLARAGDCMACHSATGRKPYAGGLAIESGLGTIYSTNITPGAHHGIGQYTEAQFANALRKGVRADGTNLYPAMPYPSYAKLTDADVHALYVYFMKGVAAVDDPAPVTQLSFPFNQRWGMALWNWAFSSDQPFIAPANANAEVQRGAYLVEGLGHCGSCHTPRGVAMNEKAFDGGDVRYLSGGSLNGWSVPPLRGIAKWSRADIVDYLQMGRNSKASVAGEMTSVVYNSTSHLSDADLNAIAAYLQSLGGDAVAASAQAASSDTAAHLTAAKNLTLGERLYLDNCSACHFVHGGGAPRVFPRLDGASVVNASSPDALLHVILAGAKTPSTAKAPSVLPMPGFAARLNDDELAALATFVRGGWTNRAAAVDAGEVRKVRAALAGK